ncbi:TetR/AcrR family transcriptional regulator [Sphaerisporangium corydalis]|uniref:TetR/AcrR family transcriptional regulator n=1 Tax=Sphaerisporangium corydalis TaxID=1441875 RepID=A0ABV9EGL8_9ACTN|nr:TetR/AcrR family transcriptional regulator [Sphaerisporangium corydalis]
MASVTRRRDRDLQERSTEAETKLVSAVERLLNAGESFTEISVQRIIEEAGVSRATFYAYFQGKPDILRRLAQKIRDASLALAEQWDPGAGEDGADRYTAFFQDVLALHRAHHPVLSAVREVATYDAAVRDFYTADLEGFDEAVLATLLEQQRAGATPSDLDAVAASRVIVWGGAQAMAHHINVDDGSGDAALARELGHIWWYGAYRRPGTTIDQPSSEDMK